MNAIMGRFKLLIWSKWNISTSMGTSSLLPILITGSIFQFINAVLGIVRVKIFLSWAGIDSLSKVTAILGIWGLLSLMSEDQRQLFRTKKINSSGFRKDLTRALKANIRIKLFIFIMSSVLVVCLERNSSFTRNISLVIILLLGYILSMSAAVLIGNVESQGKFALLGIVQTFLTFLNFIIFFPLMFTLSDLGYLINLTISSNLMLCFVLIKIASINQHYSIEEKLETIAVEKSKIFSYVLGLETCMYAFDPFLISLFRTSDEVIEYSLTRRIGLIMMVLSLSTSSYFSFLGRSGKSKIRNLYWKLGILGTFSAVVYFFISFLILRNILGSSAESIIPYQFGMILLGYASIFTSPSLSSFSSDEQLGIRYIILRTLTPLFLVLTVIGLLQIGAFFSLYSSAIYLLVYNHMVKNANKVH